MGWNGDKMVELTFDLDILVDRARMAATPP